METIYDTLLADNWREYPDQFRKYARCFFKRFDTPTLCHCNDDKDGIQVCIAVSEHKGKHSIEIDVAGELQDETWVKIHQWAMPSDLPSCLAAIPRMLKAWETIAN